MSLAREKQAAGWFWLMGRNLLTLALVDLTEYGESRISLTFKKLSFSNHTYL